MPANVFTQLTDIVHSDAFGNYVNTDSIEKNPLFSAGLVEADKDFAAAIAKNGGTTHDTVLVPNMFDLDGDPEDLVDGTPITSEKVTTGAEILPAIGKAKSFAFYDSTLDLTVADPARRIATRVGAYWSRYNKRFMFSALKGAFGVSEMTDNILDITGDSDPVLSNGAILDAFQLLGDNQDILTTILCHSAVARRMKDIGTSEYVQNAKDGEMRISAYQGKRILVDDYFAPVDGAYPIYILGPGALVMNPLPCVAEYGTKREEEYSRTSVYTRKRFVLGPRGFAYTKPKERAVDANGATNAELENTSNWDIVWEPKRIPLVKLIAQVA